VSCERSARVSARRGVECGEGGRWAEIVHLGRKSRIPRLEGRGEQSKQVLEAGVKAGGATVRA